ADPRRAQAPAPASRRLEPPRRGDRVCAQHATRGNMNLLSSLRSLVTALVNRGRIENDTDEELRAHVQNRADDLEHSGLTRAEAERRARIEFGGHEKFREECRETGGGNQIGRASCRGRGEEWRGEG